MGKALLNVFLIIQIASSVFGQDKRIDVYKTELTHYIDTIRPASILNGKYEVYITNFTSLEKNKFCFEIEDIYNQSDMKYVKADYIFYYNNEIVLVRLSKNDSLLIRELNLLPIGINDSGKINDKLFPSNKGIIMSDELIGFMYCEENGNIQKRFYEPQRH